MGKVLIGLLIIVGGFAGFIAMQPSEFTVQRSTIVAAPQPTVFAQVNDFHNWANWSPWEKLDPAMERTYSGSPTGTGSVYAWSSKSKEAGAGSMTITNAKLADQIDIKLDFTEPMKATHDVVFAFAPEGEGTKVTWTMSGHQNFVMKGMCLFMGGVDKLVGPDFEKGLAAMKETSEAKHKEAIAAAAAEAKAAEEKAAAEAAATAQAEAEAAKAAPKGKAKKR